MRKKKNAFTLIELLAVIVILAVILVIAVPRILDVIDVSKKDSFKNSAQLIADSAEKKKVSDKLLGKDEEITCKDVAKINDEDYKSCIISFDREGNAKVSITGKGKFDGLKITNGTKENAEVKEITKPTYGMKATEYITNLYDYDDISNNLKRDNTKDQNIRYYGSDPNNYVSFNNELWRIIGVFGNNVKLVRKDSLGELSWDSSELNVNFGSGVNQWGESTYEDGTTYEGSDLMQYLNKMYYGGTDVTCYGGCENSTKTCPTNTLDNTAKSLIDNYTWNTGAVNRDDVYNNTIKTLDTVELYKAERGSVNGKMCSVGRYCYDTITRTTSWTGYIGLPYVTDWAYASDENDCNTMIDQSSTYKCKNNNWMHYGSTYNDSIWYLSPFASPDYAGKVWKVAGDGDVYGSSDASVASAFFPTIYLKSNVLIESGNGTSDNPYILKAGA